MKKLDIAAAITYYATAIILSAGDLAGWPRRIAEFFIPGSLGLLLADLRAGAEVSVGADGLVSVDGIELHFVEVTDAVAFTRFCAAVRDDQMVRGMLDLSEVVYMELGDEDIEIVDEIELDLCDIEIVEEQVAAVATPAVSKPVRATYTAADRAGWVSRWRAANIGARRWVCGLRAAGEATPAASSLYRWAKAGAAKVLRIAA